MQSSFVKSVIGHKDVLATVRGFSRKWSKTLGVRFGICLLAALLASRGVNATPIESLSLGQYMTQTHYGEDGDPYVYIPSIDMEYDTPILTFSLTDTYTIGADGTWTHLLHSDDLGVDIPSSGTSSAMAPGLYTSTAQSYFRSYDETTGSVEAIASTGGDATAPLTFIDPYAPDVIDWTTDVGTNFTTISGSQTLKLTVNYTVSPPEGTWSEAGATAELDFVFPTGTEMKNCNQCGDSGCQVIQIYPSEPCPPGWTAAPISYANGAIKLQSAPMLSHGFGRAWGPTTSIANQNLTGSMTTTGPMGANTVAGDLPFVVKESGGRKMTVVGSGTGMLYFQNNVVSGTPVYTEMMNAPYRLSAPTTASTPVLTDPRGGTVTFQAFDDSVPSGQKGKFKSSTDANGITTSVINYNGAGQPVDVDRSVGSGSSTITERFEYAYVTSGGMVQSVTLERRVGSSGAFTPVRVTYYTQYGTSESYGNQGDLKYIVLKDPSGNMIDTTYYRYYKLSDGPGSAHDVKCVFGPASYERLLAWCNANATTPEAASDNDAKKFADNYFEYDGNHHVTLEKVQGGGCSCSSSPGGQGTYTYSENEDNNNATYTDSFNKWKHVVVETLPDGSTNKVYTNYAGEVMLKITNSSAGVSAEFYKYDFFGHLAWKADPSVFTPYGGALCNPSSDDLMDFSGEPSVYIGSGGVYTYGTSPYLSSSNGLIHVYIYALVTIAGESTVGPVNGYLSTESVQHGLGGTAKLIKLHKYKSNPSVTAFYEAATTLYRNEGDTTGLTTTVDYGYYSETDRIKTRTTTKPIVSSTAENGPTDSTADVTMEYLDQCGNVTWTKDANGYITYSIYDIPTGALKERIVDADTISSTYSSDFLESAPDGFSSISGITHLHLKTVYVVDGLGRTTQETDPQGNITYTFYDDPNHAVRTYAGWTTSSASSTIPFTFQREDRVNNYRETLTAKITHSSSPPAGTETGVFGTTYPYQIQTLSREYLDTSGRPIESDVYFSFSGISSYSTGALGAVHTNYYSTTYAYDTMGRKSRVCDPEGDITRTVYDAMGRVSSIWKGTSDTVVGVWSPTNAGGLIEVAANAYDDTVGVYFATICRDSNLIQQTQYLDVSGTNKRVTQMYYDWRDRLLATKSGALSTTSAETSASPLVHRPIVVSDLDNLGECTARYLYDGDGLTVSVSGSPAVATVSDTSKLRAKTTYSYDDQGRLFRTQVYSVTQVAVGTTPAGTVTSSSLISNIFYDHRGNVVAASSPGGVVNRNIYDGAGRRRKTFTTDGTSSLSWSVTPNDSTSIASLLSTLLSGIHVLNQRETTYDRASNVIFTVNRDVNTPASGGPGTGVLTTSNARSTYSFAYYNAANQLIESVNVGTNGGVLTGSGASVDLTSDAVRPSTAPTSSTATVLITTTDYNSAGWPNSVKDPNGMVTLTSYDAKGRVTESIEDSGAGHLNRTTDYTYDGLDHTLSIASNGEKTQYDYGVTTTTSPTSAINSNALLFRVQYPNKNPAYPDTPSSSSSDWNTFTYDALGEVVTKKDQIGNVHTYTYDVLGRTTLDAITTIVSGVDSSIKSIGISFDTAGRPYQLTSYSDASGTTAVNQILKGDFNVSTGDAIPGYNGFGQLLSEYQSHSGTVTSSNYSSTPQVVYTYSMDKDDGTTALNASRLSAIKYPDGRTVNYLHTEADNSSGVSATGVSDNISRVTAIATASDRGTYDANAIVTYDYLGLSNVVRKNYPNPAVRMDRFGGTSGTYTGLDKMNRVISQEWTAYHVTTFPYSNTSGADVFKINHGYDQDSNRLYADNKTQSSAGHVYSYDTLNRLTQDQTGTVMSSETSTLAFQSRNDTWALDVLGNPTTVTPLINTEVNTVNNQNQITSRKVTANGATGIIDSFATDTSSQWAATEGSFSIGSGYLAISSLGVDDEALIALKQRQGPPGEISTAVSLPSTGKAGLICGPCSLVADTSAGTLTLSCPGGTTTVSTSFYGGVNLDMVVTANSCWCAAIGGSPITFTGGVTAPFAGSAGGNIGVYTTVSGASFSTLYGFNPATRSNLFGRWTSFTAGGVDNTVTPGTCLWPGINWGPSAVSPILAKNLHLQKFQADFEITGGDIQFVFDAKNDYNWKSVTIGSYDTWASQTVNGGAPTDVSGDSAPENIGGSWIRVKCDGSSITVYAAADESSLDSASACFSTSGFTITGGMLGFAAGDSGAEVVCCNIKSYSGSSFSTTELDENFTVDTSGYYSDTLTYDNNGNLTYDGTQAYTYDAWNRLATVSHAYRDSGGTLHVGQVSEVMGYFDTDTYHTPRATGYDAAGRRIMKSIRNTGSMDMTDHAYFNGQSVIEERNGSNQFIKDHVWGLTYVDEAVQTRINTNLTTPSWTSYWHLQDANFNDLGLVNASGTLAERYEYSAYGLRQPFISVGSNDPGCYTPTALSTRVITSGSVIQPYGVNDIGHQGLVHDEESGLVYSRARMLNSTLGRFMQEDPLGYVDGLNSYGYVGVNPLRFTDPRGTDFVIIDPVEIEDPIVSPSPVTDGPIWEPDPITSPSTTLPPPFPFMTDPSGKPKCDRPPECDTLKAQENALSNAVAQYRAQIDQINATIVDLGANAPRDKNGRLDPTWAEVVERLKQARKQLEDGIAVMEAQMRDIADRMVALGCFAPAPDPSPPPRSGHHPHAQVDMFGNGWSWN